MLYTFGAKGAVVRSIQSKVGAQVTGVWTTTTYRKVHDYQKANGLQQTGEVDQETHDHMFPPKKVTFKDLTGLPRSFGGAENFFKKRFLILTLS